MIAMNNNNNNNNNDNNNDNNNNNNNNNTGALPLLFLCRVCKCTSSIVAMRFCSSSSGAGVHVGRPAWSISLACLAEVVSGRWISKAAYLKVMARAWSSSAAVGTECVRVSAFCSKLAHFTCLSSQFVHVATRTKIRESNQSCPIPIALV